MRNTSYIFGLLFFVAIAFFSCSTDEFDLSQEDTTELEMAETEDEINLEKALSSTQWNVQSACVGSGNFTTDISNRYDYTSSKLTLFVKSSDKDINCNTSGNPRTELRGLKEFKPSDGSKHQMAVTTKVTKLKLTSGRRLILGQIFSKSDSDDFGTLSISSSGNLVAEFAGTGKKTMRTNVKAGSTVSFKMYTQNGKSTISVGTTTYSSTKSAGDTCYFKTGAYLISRLSGDEAEVEITNLSQS